MNDGNVIKLIILGDSYTGKTSIISNYYNCNYKNDTRILNHKYDLSWSPAISVEIDILNMISTIQLCIEKDVS